MNRRLRCIPTTMPATRTCWSLVAALALSGCSAFAGGPSSAGPVNAASSGTSTRPQQADEGPRPFEQVIPPDALSDEGFITVHRVGSDWFLQVPRALMGRDLLLITRYAGVPAGFGGFPSAGMSVREQVIRFEEREDRLLVRKLSFRAVADEEEPIYRSVVSNHLPPVLAAFDVEALTADSTAVVVEVTDFFQGDTPALSGLSQAQRRDYGVRRLDPARSFITRMSAYPENLEVRHTQTFEATSPPGTRAPAPSPWR